MASIGDLFFRLFADGSQLTPQVEKAAAEAGAAGGKTLGQSLSSSLKAGAFTAFGTVAAGGFAIAMKGAIELEDVQAQLIAQTGVSADEAARMAKNVNSVAGAQRMSLQAVQEIAIRVHNDLGLAGDAADAMVSKVAEFARVTRQDGAQVVSSIDDIGDAWKLNADRLVPLMDQLLVSQQQYGGSIQESEAALHILAPTMQAFGGSIDDAVALLNLFNASGIDATKGAVALNRAIKNLKPGETFDQLLASITSIKDPTLRAQAAIKIFGQRAGAAFAQASGGLKDYAVSAEDAAGATDKAAEALDSTFSGRIQKAISQAGAAIRGFGADFGPALTGAAAISSLFGGIFGPGAAAKAAGGLRKVIAGGLAKAGGTAAAKAAGQKIGVAFWTAALRGQLAKTALQEAFSALPASGAIKSAGSRIGQLLGSGAGTAFAVAFAAIAWVEVLQTYNQIKGQLAAQSGQISDSVSKEITKGTTASLEQSKAAIQKGITQINGVWDAGLFTTDTRRKLESDLAAVNAELDKRAAAGGTDAGTAAADGFVTGFKTIKGKTTGIFKPIADMLAFARGAGRNSGYALVDSFSQGVLDRQGKAAAAMQSLENIIKNDLSRNQRIAQDVGFLTSKTLAKGLTDGRGAVREAAQLTRANWEAEIVRLIQQGGKTGKAAQKALADAMKSKDPEVRKAARRTQQIVNDALNNAPPKAEKTGERVDGQLAGGLRSNSGVVATAAARLATIIGNNLLKALRSQGTGGKGAKSQASKRSALGRTMVAGVPYSVNENTSRSEVFVPGQTGRLLSYSDAMRALSTAAAGTGGDTVHINVPITGVIRAESPSEVAARVQQLAVSGVLTSRRSREKVTVRNG